VADQRAFGAERGGTQFTVEVLLLAVGVQVGPQDVGLARTKTKGRDMLVGRTPPLLWISLEMLGIVYPFKEHGVLALCGLGLGRYGQNLPSPYRQLHISITIYIMI